MSPLHPARAPGFRLEGHVARAFPEAPDLLTSAATALRLQTLARWQSRAVTVAEKSPRAASEIHQLHVAIRVLQKSGAAAIEQPFSGRS